MLILVIEELFTKLNPLLLPENQVGILFSNTSLASSFLPQLSNIFFNNNKGSKALGEVTKTDDSLLVDASSLFSFS